MCSVVPIAGGNYCYAPDQKLFQDRIKGLYPGEMKETGSCGKNLKKVVVGLRENCRIF